MSGICQQHQVDAILISGYDKKIFVSYIEKINVEFTYGDWKMKLLIFDMNGNVILLAQYYQSHCGWNDKRMLLDLK